MDILRILDLVIGIIFIYFILSIVASATLEIVANFLMFRANDLRDWVYSTFNQPYGYKKPSFFKRLRIKFKKFEAKLFGKEYKGEPKCLGEEIWHHFTVDGLSRAGKKVSYIPSSEFVRAMFDIIVTVKLKSSRDLVLCRQDLFDDYGNQINAVDKHEKPITDKLGNIQTRLQLVRKVRDLIPKSYSIDNLKHSVITSPFLSNDQASTILQYIADDYNLYEVRRSFESWFDKAMERLTGDYKRFSQRFLFFNGIAIAFLFNVDTLALTNFLYTNPDRSTKFAESITNALNNPNLNIALQDLSSRNPLANPASADTVKARLSYLKELNRTLQDPEFPMGWEKEEIQFVQTNGTPGSVNPFDYNLKIGTIRNPLSKFFGILITGFSLSLGATFWFDILNKLVNLRAAGRKPGETNDNDAVG